MGVILTQHVTYTGGGLLKGLVGSQTALVHGVENTAVDRLQTITNIGQSTSLDDAHGVLKEGAFHFLHQRRFGDHLIGEHNVLRFVIAIVCHFTSPP